MSYNCPGCNNIMNEEICGSGLPPNYYCLPCGIFYLKLHEIQIHNSEFIVNGKTLCHGTFNHCCRIYKLKAFV